MRQKKVWRYYCDHCNKGGCSKAAMAKHEQHCIHNPVRECRMCLLSHSEEQATVPELIEAAAVSLKHLREVAHGCPVCMLTGIVKSGEDRALDCSEFSYKDESNAVFAEANAARWEGVAR